MTKSPLEESGRKLSIEMGYILERMAYERKNNW